MSIKNRTVSLLLSIIMMLGILSLSASAVSSNKQLILYGDAVNIYDDVYELTECATWKSGSVWISEKISTRNDFTVSFSYYAGGGRDYSYGGADGIVLSFSQEIGLGSDGEYMGFISGDSYGVEFDSYSGNFNDPVEKHIAVIYGQSSNHLAYVLDDRVDDSTWHDVEVIYANSSLAVYLDGERILFCQDIQLADEIYLGLSAATGGGRNQHLISDFQYSYTQDKIANGEFRFSSNAIVNCVAKNMTFDIYAGYYVDDILSSRNYLATVGDDSIIQINSNSWDSSHGQHLSLTAKKTGSTTITIVDLTNNVSGSLEICVVDSETVCSFDNVPKMTIEENKTTNFYNYSGMVVDDFNYKEVKSANGAVDHYAVTMTAYNTLDLYGAVTAYDADGNIYDYCVIEKFTSMDSSFFDSMKSLIKSTGDLFYLAGNKQYYSGESISKETKVSVDVPAGGYLEISNNATSPVALFANVTGITIDFMATTDRLASSSSKLLGSKSLIVNQVLLNAFAKDYAGEEAVKTIKELAKQELKNGDWSLNNFGDGLHSLFDVLIDSGIDLVGLIAKETISITGIINITESIVIDIIPTGQIITFLYGLSDTGELIIEVAELAKSVDHPQGIYLYTSSFSDVSTTAYYSDAVQWAMMKDITSGTSATAFSPNMSCTRAQMVTFLWRAAGEPEPQSTYNPFSDVSSDAYYYDAVLWTVEQGITSGTSAATFSPHESCTRGQAVTFLYRYAGTPTVNLASSFDDVSDNAYYADAVRWAVTDGVTSGTSATTFSPLGNCTRAQIVTFLYRYLA